MSTKHTGVLVPQAEESIEEVAWFSKEEIEATVLSNSYPAILKVL